MKKVVTMALICLVSVMAWAKPKNSTDKNSKQAQTTYKIETAAMQSTLTYDGDAYLKLAAFKLNSATLKVQILQDGVALMTAYYQEMAINEGFNLQALPAGNYTVKFTIGKEETERKITKTTQALIFE